MQGDERLCECANCRRRFKESKLDGYKDFWSRTETGGEIPAGDCPRCGALAYLIREPKTVTVIFGQCEEARSQTKTTKEFDTEAEKAAYLEGLEDMDGWLDYEIIDAD